jgi:hypothetical protein
MSDANFTQRFRMCHELLHKIFRGRCGECLVEFDDEQVPDPQVADQFDLVLCSSQQVGSLPWPKHFHGMRVESNDHRCAICCLGVLGRSGNDGLMAAMHTVKYPDGEKEGAT